MVEPQGAGREAFGEAPGDLVVAAVDVEAFVGFRAEAAELDQHRDRRQAVDVEPVLLGHELFGGEAEELLGAVGEGAVEPLGGGHLVELPRGAGRPVPADGANATRVGMGASADQVLVALDLGEAADLAVEEEAGVGAGPLARRRFEVVEGEAVLGGLPGGELARRPAASPTTRPSDFPRHIWRGKSDTCPRAVSVSSRRRVISRPPLSGRSLR